VTSNEHASALAGMELWRRGRDCAETMDGQDERKSRTAPRMGGGVADWPIGLRKTASDALCRFGGAA